MQTQKISRNTRVIPNKRFLLLKSNLQNRDFTVERNNGFNESTIYEVFKDIRTLRIRDRISSVTIHVCFLDGKKKTMTISSSASSDIERFIAHITSGDSQLLHKIQTVKVVV